MIGLNGNPISNGDTIFSATIDTNGFASEIVQIKNISATTIDVKVRKIVCDTVPGSENSICWGGSCFGASVYTSPSTVNFLANDLYSGFSADYTPLGHAGITLMRYKFYNINVSTDTICVYVQFNSMIVGISENTPIKASFSNSYPNPANNFTTFNYNLPNSNGNAKFVLRNLLGSTVKEIQLNDLQGSVNVPTNNLKSGVYFYSFIVDDKIVSTKKLVINH